MADKWIPSKGERFWTFTGEPEDPVQQLRWGVDDKQEQEMLRLNRVCKNKTDAEIARAQQFPSPKVKPPSKGITERD
jgi:hypothetical protein